MSIDPVNISQPTAGISVLMATYAGEKAPRLRMALESMFRQTLLPKEVVLVVDGPVDGEQEKVIQEFSGKDAPPELKVLRLNEGKGLAGALNHGLTYCSCGLIARMDSDDISREDRLEKQYRFLEQHPDIDVVASWQAEFENDDTERTVKIKETPAEHEAIVRKLRWRNVISHPTIMIRKAALLKVSGYDETVGLLEDYDLHMRLIAAGSRYAAIQELLVKVRISRSQRARRGGVKYIFREGRFRYRCYQRGSYSFGIFLVTFTTNAVFRLMPPFLKAAMYRLVRRPIPE